MDPEVARAAQTLADHAILLLVLGIGMIGVALAVVIAAARVARRYQRPLSERWTWLATHVRRIRVLRPVLGGARAAMPTGYLALHLVLGLLATAAAMAFVIIAEEVFAGQAVATFDHAFASALHNSASPRWQQVFRTITWFGSGEVLGVASAVIAAILLVRHDYVLAIGWVVGQAGSAVLNITLKGAFERTRPESADSLLQASSWSFPSGHAMSTFVFFGLGVYLILRFTRSWTMTAAVVAASFTWCLVMGFSRLYLGVHFASDVVAGLIAATAWVAVCVSGIEVGLRGANGGRR